MQSLYGYQEPRIRFEDIGNFLTFLAVNETERQKKVMDLVKEMEPLVKVLRKKQAVTTEGVVGLNFEGLLKLMVEVDALNAFELTEKERVSVLST